MISRIKRWLVREYEPLPSIPGFPNCNQCFVLLRGRMVLRLMDHLHRHHDMHPFDAQELSADAGHRLLIALKRDI